MKLLLVMLGTICLGLQYRIWLGSSGLAEIASLQREIDGQAVLNASMKERNRVLEIEVRELQQGTEGFEEKAREEMGMIKKGETFFLYVPQVMPQAPPQGPQ
jgi:cell division protein FtsB